MIPELTFHHQIKGRRETFEEWVTGAERVTGRHRQRRHAASILILVSLVQKLIGRELTLGAINS